MSIRYMTAVWDDDRLMGSRLLVMLALADHANDEGLCWPSMERLARRARVSKRQARRIVSDLRAEGFIEIIEEGGGRGRTSLVRVINPDIQRAQGGETRTSSAPAAAAGAVNPDIQRAKGDNLSSFSGDGAEETRTSGAVNPDISDRNPDIQRAKGDIAVSSEPPIEPPLEPSVVEPPPQPACAGAGQGLAGGEECGGGGGGDLDDFRRVTRAWQKAKMPGFTETVTDYLREWIEEFGAAEVVAAIGIAALAEKRTGRYVAGVLRKRREDAREAAGFVHGVHGGGRPPDLGGEQGMAEPAAVQVLREIRGLAGSRMRVADGVVLVTVRAPDVADLQWGGLARRALASAGIEATVRFVPEEAMDGKSSAGGSAGVSEVRAGDGEAAEHLRDGP